MAFADLWPLFLALGLIFVALTGYNHIVRIRRVLKGDITALEDNSVFWLLGYGIGGFFFLILFLVAVLQKLIHG